MATKPRKPKGETVAEVVPTSAEPTVAEMAEVATSLAAVVAAAQCGGFCYTLPELHVSLIEQGLVEINPAMMRGDAIATRATEAGIAAFLQASEPVAEVATPVETNQPNPEAKIMTEVTKSAKSAKSAIVIEDNIAIPDSRQGGRSGESYPFGRLNVGQSFFIPADEKRNNPVKDFASTVSSATARYAVPHESETRANRKGEVVPVMVETRKFIIRAVDGGARVWRTL